MVRFPPPHTLHDERLVTDPCTKSALYFLLLLLVPLLSVTWYFNLCSLAVHIVCMAVQKEFTWPWHSKYNWQPCWISTCCFFPRLLYSLFIGFIACIALLWCFLVCGWFFIFIYPCDVLYLEVILIFKALE